MTSRRADSAGLSLVMPCYNEQDSVGYTIPKLIAAFRAAGHCLELVVVDNGSRDRTGDLIGQLAAREPWIVTHRVEVNEGYGRGILAGISRCTAPWVGMIAADGQVDAEDVVRLFEAARVTNGEVLAKVRRRFRMDGVRRKVVSVVYNLLVRLLWPGLASLDINGTPKILRRDYLLAMDLQSKGWLLDAELMIKAYDLGLRVIELNVFARMRGAGVSHVRPSTCWEFLRSLLRFRFSRRFRAECRRARSNATRLRTADTVWAPSHHHD
jgi:glycosyltransferase involved in cell wall biosynthesis